MKKIVAGMTALGMAAALAACGTNTTANETALDDGLGNETVFNDEFPADGNLTVTDNALAAPAFGNGADNAFAADPVANGF